jgi:hypothetical protein
MNTVRKLPARSAEQRQDRRFPFRLAVTLVRGREEIPLRTDDVSFQGLFLETDEPVPLRQLVRLRLLLPPFHRELIAHGMAVHAVRPEGDPIRPPGVGVQLYGLDRAARNVWSDFVARVRQGELDDRRIAVDEIRFLEPEILG